VVESQPPDEIVELVTNADRDKFSVTLQVVAHHMTTTAANAQIEIAKQTFAIPAQELTKQAQELTKRSSVDGIVRMGFGSTLAAVACIALHGSPITLGGVLVAIAGIFGGKPLIEAIKKKPD